MIVETYNKSPEQFVEEYNAMVVTLKKKEKEKAWTWIIICLWTLAFNVATYMAYEMGINIIGMIVAGAGAIFWTKILKWIDEGKWSCY